MRKKAIVGAALASSLVTVALAFPTTSGAVAAGSPGACNMLNVSRSAVGFDGMLQSGNGQGLANMMELVLASEAAGCTP
jgi:hypothetical protein